LWRGVFRKPLHPYRRKFPWISIIETDDEKQYRQSVMRVAKIGEGAIFATTMMLALTGQRELVSAILRCAGGNTLHLPTPVTAVERLRSSAKLILTVFGGLLAALVVGRAGTLTRGVENALKGIGVSDSTVQSWVQLAMVALGLALVAGAYRIYRWLRKHARDFVGY
jgi:hypothetical protein